MRVETLVPLFIEAAETLIQDVDAVSWIIGDEVFAIREDLRECLEVLSRFRQDLPVDEALDWVSTNLNENLVLDQVRLRYN